MQKLIDIFKKIDDFLDGHKQMGASLVMAVTSTAVVIHNIAQQGWPYLLNVPHSPEFAAAGVGWIGFFNALKGEKIRAAIEATAAIASKPILVGTTCEPVTPEQADAGATVPAAPADKV